MQNNEKEMRVYTCYFIMGDNGKCRITKKVPNDVSGEERFVQLNVQVEEKFFEPNIFEANVKITEDQLIYPSIRAQCKDLSEKL